MPSNYIPASDSGFQTWLLNFSTLLTAAPATYGLLPADAVIVAAQYTAWNAAYVPTTNPATRTSPAIAAKDQARAAAEAVVRPYAVQISLNAGVTDQAKVDIGVTVKKTVPTPVPEPTTMPALALKGQGPLVAQLAYSDPSAPVGKAKPAGVVGVELWQSIGTLPAVDPGQAGYTATVTKSPFALTYNAADRGKTATIWARWTTRSGPGGRTQVGPWSNALTLVIS